MKKNSKKQQRNWTKEIILSIVALLILFIYNNYGVQLNSYASNYLQLGFLQDEENEAEIVFETSNLTFDLNSIPEYSNAAYVIINDNNPDLSENDYPGEPFEIYSELDSLGRCGVAYASICKKIMPKANEKRGEISSIYPTGWKNKEYKNIIKDGGYLYNRCHLIGWQLAGENANEKNLITGTRYLNVEGMLPFENKVADYLSDRENRNNHVLYRVTPIYEGANLVASGVQMEAYSVEDNGEGVKFNIYVYNVQPGIEIDYATGESKIQK